MLLIFSDLSLGGGADATLLSNASQTTALSPACVGRCALSVLLHGVCTALCSVSSFRSLWLWQWCEEMVSSLLGRNKKRVVLSWIARKAPLLFFFFFLLFSNKVGKETTILGTRGSFRCECQQNYTYLWLYFSEGITERRELEAIKCHFLQRPGQKREEITWFLWGLW